MNTFDLELKLRDPSCKPCESIVQGDTIVFKESVFGGSYKKPTFLGHRWISGTVVKESYGEKTGQHTFTIEVDKAQGMKSGDIKKGKKIRRMGRNVYGECCVSEAAAERAAKLEEKHRRGARARKRRYGN